MGEDMVAKLLSEQRKRLVASILGAAESSSWWRKLTVEEQKAHREKVLAAVGVFYDLMRDIIKVSGEDTVRNEYAVNLLQQVHESQRRLERQGRQVEPSHG